MRTICIRHKAVQEVFLTAAALPKDFQVLCVDNAPEPSVFDFETEKKTGPVKIRWVGKGKDPRVTNRLECASVESKYASRFKRSMC